MDGGAWEAAVHGVARSRTRLSDFTFTFHFHALEKEMATHSSVPAWRISGMGEPGGLPSMGSHRVWHDWSDLAAAAAAECKIAGQGAYLQLTFFTYRLTSRCTLPFSYFSFHLSTICPFHVSLYQKRDIIQSSNKIQNHQFGYFFNITNKRVNRNRCWSYWHKFETQEHLILFGFMFSYSLGWVFP